MPKDSDVVWAGPARPVDVHSPMDQGGQSDPWVTPMDTPQSWWEWHIKKHEFPETSRGAGTTIINNGESVPFPAPGSLVLPSWTRDADNSASVEHAGGYYRQQDIIEYPGGVRVARMWPFANDDSADRNVQTVSGGKLVVLATDITYSGSTFDDGGDPAAEAKTMCSFKPVDDLQLDPDQLYGVFFSWRLATTSGAGNRGMFFWQSDTTALADEWDLTDAPSQAAFGVPQSYAMPWSFKHLTAPTPGADEFKPLSYFGLGAVGMLEMFNGFPIASRFATGETISVSGITLTAGTLYLDYLVFVPWSPIVDIDFTDPHLKKDSFSFGVDVLDYDISVTGGSRPGSVTNPTDSGWWFPGDTMSDSQALNGGPLDSSNHLTIVAFDNGSTPALFSSVMNVHVYAMVRGHRTAGTYFDNHASDGMLTAFQDATAKSTTAVDPGGGWHFAYLGEFPLSWQQGDNAPQLMAWLARGSYYQTITRPFDAIRLGLVLFVPSFYTNVTPQPA